MVILVVAGFYAAAGFWGLPYLIKSKLPGAVREQTGQAASLGRVSFNPFSLRLEAEDFVLGPAQPKPLASVKRLVVDLSAASLWRWALICEELTLDEPFLKVILRAEGSLNLAQLSSAQAAPAVADPDREPFPFLLRKLKILKGSLWFLREQQGRPGKLRVIPIDLELSDLSTMPELCGLPAECGPFNLTAASPQGERLMWRGRLSLSPLASSGRVKLEGWKLATLYEVTPEIASLAPPRGVLDLSAAYEMALNGGGLDLKLDPVELKLRQVVLAQEGEGARLQVEGMDAAGKLRLDRPGEKYRLRLGGLKASLQKLNLGRKGQPPLLTLDDLTAEGGSLDLERRSLSLESLKLSGGRALAALGKDGKLNWNGLLPAKKAAQQAKAPAAPAKAGPGWKLSLKRASLDGYGLHFSDQSGSEPAELELNQLKLGLDNLAWPLAEPWPFSLEGNLASGGKVAAKGKLISLAPDLEAEYALEAVNLKPLQPYLARVAEARLAEGGFSSRGRLALGKPAKGKGLTLEARASLSGLSLRELDGEDELLGLDTLATQSLSFELEPASLSVERADLSGPRFKVVIGPKGEINLAQKIKGGEGSGPAPAEDGKAAKKPALAFQLGVLNISGGKLDFSDLSLEPKFSSIVRDLRGSARDVGNQVSSSMPLRLRGRVDRYGQAKIAGRLLPLDPASRSRLKMDFENLDLHHLSPYAAKFAGWRIKEGKLYLEMDYRLENQRLVGSNQVLIKDLVLGEKIDEPGAPNLPLDLAVALLKDSRGRIEIAVPISGDLSDPQVSVSGLLGAALGNLASKVITAPFSLLANLVGAGGEELDRVDFDPGSHRVAPPQEEKLAKLAQAMKKRPQLKLEISGGFNPGLDGPALKRRSLVAELTKMSGQEVAGRTQKRVSLSSAAAGRSIEALYLKRYSRSELDRLKREVAATPGRDGKKRGAKRLATAQRRAMFRALLKKQPLDPARLTELAGQRASAAAKLLTGRYGLPPGRLAVSPPREQPPGEDKTVPSPLSLASGE
ncbi:MAG: DUF748 domain-containing protein [Desulfarculaceae bacterium]|nr:DUF748 domain-containing protein [Desulfarculaceae bacterium]MCF8072459.1 DUF748 domain-containing protein [Desulfarculaceae bacterium]MCF8102920.1 DUF748 domain-containing protein [Desulfarculaceae bacterium]MCF8117477.1 DUF748 domain-containing protein [Desulfarculaceae bacterium]